MTARSENTAESSITTSPFSKIITSAKALRLQCDPFEVIFDVTVDSAEIKTAVFFFRLKDKASGLVNSWSNVEMRPAGARMFETILQAKTIPGEARYWNAWIQYQFVGLDQNKQAIGHSQIFSQDISYQPGCP